ncbi:MAG: elongation factor P [Bacteroidota bacterium]|jgi:elongation factor P|nr:elongation factor P [Bacteroidales bacterium]MDI9536212.1 elongation factor P [Bacteroidota bacterium]OQC46414.1 MAG: Elongation factor P [Bacteroidetes bacterium ADurb.Bin028]HNY43667.1 elongation factor P [Bacteroidales bacterium]HOD88642.1 elongation factor P [Bacteroidales bacterium]
MATTADIKNGLTIEFNGKPYQITYFQHVKPGKGAAFVRTKMKSLENGRVIENTFPSGAKIDIIRIERRPYQFLYNDDLGYHFMHLETFEQVCLSEDLIEGIEFLKEGQEVEVIFHAENEAALTCELPAFIISEVTYTEPGLKGDTTTNALKPATIDTGASIMVPLFINIGEKIKVDTRTKEYVERAK